MNDTIDIHEQFNQLKQEKDALEVRLAQAEEQARKQLEIQQRLVEINNNYLMLHYLNKNIQDCRSSQAVWRTYLQNIGERGFNYTHVMVLLPDDKGTFCNKISLRGEELDKETILDNSLEDYVLQAIETKEVRSSADNLQVAVPMVNNCGSILALLCAEKKRGIFFEDIQLLEVYVQQTVATVENIMLNEKLFYYQELLGKRMDQFVMLHYIAQEINSATDYYDLLKKYLNTLCSPVGFQFNDAVMYIIENDKLQKAFLVDNRLAVESIDVFDNPLAERALLDKSVVMEYDVELALPLNFLGKINAIICVKKDEGIEPEQVQILETFAMQTSATLENTRLNMNLEYLSFHDTLTTLYNRLYFEHEMKRIENESLFPAGVIMCDVDGLKLINDNLGHAAGDELIKEASAMIREAASGHVVARIGGDEFAVLVASADFTEVKAIATKLRTAMIQYNEGQQEFPVWISVGWAATDKPDSVANLLKEADRRMYEDKMRYASKNREEIVKAIRYMKDYGRGIMLPIMELKQI